MMLPKLKRCIVAVFNFKPTWTGMVNVKFDGLFIYNKSEADKINILQGTTLKFFGYSKLKVCVRISHAEKRGKRKLGRTKLKEENNDHVHLDKLSDIRCIQGLFASVLLITAAEAARTGSAGRWGYHAWPRLPLTSALKKAHPASTGPGLEPMMEVGSSWKTWAAKMASTPLRAPSSIILCAPTPASSAGWNSSLTVPCIIVHGQAAGDRPAGDARGSSGSWRRPGASPHARRAHTHASCRRLCSCSPTPPPPAGRTTSGAVRGGRDLDGEGVHVGTEGHVGRPAAADGGDDAGLRQGVPVGDSHAVQLLPYEGARLHLLVGELWQLVDPPPHPPQPAPHFRRGSCSHDLRRQLPRLHLLAGLLRRSPLEARLGSGLRFPPRRLVAGGNAAARGRREKTPRCRRQQAAQEKSEEEL